MKKLTASLLAAVSINAAASLSITPMTIDCRHAAAMSRDLERFVVLFLQKKDLGFTTFEVTWNDFGYRSFFSRHIHKNLE